MCRRGGQGLMLRTYYGESLARIGFLFVLSQSGMVSGE
jgi:hypothetical protein